MTAADDAYSRVLAQADAYSSADAAAVGVAVYAGVRLADRLRCSIGMVVGVRTLTGDAITGAVVDVAADGAVAIDDRRSSAVWVVMPLGIGSIAGLAQGHRPAGDRVEQHRSIGALLRPAVGSQATVALGPARITGMLERVGADHLQLATAAGQEAVPFAALAWCRAPRAAVIEPVG